MLAKRSIQAGHRRARAERCSVWASRGGRLLGFRRGCREINLVPRSLIEKHESLEARHLIGHELPDLALRDSVSLGGPVEGVAYFQRDACSILSRYERRRI